MLFDAQATSASSSDLFTDLHCAEENDAAFFCHAMRWMAIRSPHDVAQWHKHTHVYSCLDLGPETGRLQHV